MMNNNLEIVKALIKEMNEELKGGQKKLDVAAPFGKITGADFAALRAKKGVKKEDATDDKIDHSELNMLKKMYAKTPTAKIKAMIDKLEDKLGVKTEVRFEMPKSVEDLPEYDGLYYVGGFVDIDGSPWVSREEAEEILHNLTEGEDHEVSMANNSIDSIIWAAGELKKHLQGGERDIPAWIQDHITNAENYILQAAKNYHEYGAEEAPEAEPMPDEISLQEMIKKVGSKYNVYSKKGKKLGSHPSKKKAKKQMAAIEISKQGK